MDRPKTGPSIGIRIPGELQVDVDAAAARSGVTRSAWVTDCIEMRLKLEWVLRADWYMLRGIDPESPRLHGVTVGGIVEQRLTPRPVRG